jgi:hypothetical protein
MIALIDWPSFWFGVVATYVFSFALWALFLWAWR